MYIPYDENGVTLVIPFGSSTEVLVEMHSILLRKNVRLVEIIIQCGSVLQDATGKMGIIIEGQ